MAARDTGESLRQRALNVIWTGAEEYGFEPQFMAFTRQGEPDIYMDSIIGYARKWYGREKLEELFDLWERSGKRDTFDGLLWVALEAMAYQRELPQRPVLRELRRERAELFFRERVDQSRQQWMAEDSTVAALRAASWNQALGREPRLAIGRERALFKDLELDPQLSPEELRERFLDILRRYYRFRPGRADPAGRLLRFMGKLLPKRKTGTLRTGDLVISKSRGRGQVRGAGRQDAGKPTEREMDFIHSLFGPGLLTPAQEQELDERLCVDAHRLCRVYLAAQGKAPEAKVKDQELAHQLYLARTQARLNREEYRRHQRQYTLAIEQLTEQIEASLMLAQEVIDVPGRRGVLDCRQVWRGELLGDSRVFKTILPRRMGDFTVDLLLDASASRLQDQQAVAAQAYVVERSLNNCGIPVQVCSFLSMKGCTAVKRLRAYGDKDGEGIFDYFAAGWNRDGLAFQALEELMAEAPSNKRLLIVFTDASPNDDRQMPPKDGSLRSREYSGRAALEDTKQALDRLRAQGIEVMAVLTGGLASHQGAKYLYGDDYVIVDSTRSLARGVGRLMVQGIDRLDR